MKIGTTELIVGGVLLLLLWPKKQSGTGTKPAPRPAPQLPTLPATQSPKGQDSEVGCPYHCVI